jgi:hypothetical protein
MLINLIEFKMMKLNQWNLTSLLDREIQKKSYTFFHFPLITV